MSPEEPAATTAETNASHSYIRRTSGLKTKDYLGYAMIDTAGCFTFALVTTLLQKFYTDVFHLSPLFIMIMFVIARIWDGINDPIMGRIADTMKPAKSGRYLPWIKRVAFPFAAVGILMFVRWPGLGESASYGKTCIYATITYVVYGMVYTALQIPYGSLATVVTTDDHERSKLSVWRSMGAALGSIPALALASFAYAKRLDEAGNPVIGENGKVITDLQYRPVLIGVIAIALVSMVMLFISFKLNRERVKTKPQPKEKGAGRKTVKVLLGNRAFVAISLASMLLLAGQMFTQSFYTYLFNDYFHANWMNLASQACTYSPMLIMMLILPKMAKNIGKREISVSGVTLAALANLALFFMRGISPDRLIWPFLGLCFISGCGLTVLVMQLWAMASDAIDDVYVRSGNRDDGTAYSYFAFFRKLGQVIAAVCVNGALLGMNYKYEKGAVQTLENLRHMYNLATLIPAVMFGVMAAILFFMFPLTKPMVADLQDRKEQKLREHYESRKIDI